MLTGILIGVLIGIYAIIGIICAIIYFISAWYGGREKIITTIIVAALWPIALYFFKSW